MFRHNMLRSTPFRLALKFSVLFMTAFILSGLIVYQQLRADLADRLDETVRHSFSLVAASHVDGDLEDLIATVDLHAKLDDTNEQLFSLINALGDRIAGDLGPAHPSAGFSTLSGKELGLPEHLTYRALSGPVGDTLLTVAISSSETDELEAIFLASFGWTTVIILGLAVIGGVLLATGVQRRLDSIGATMDSVSHGNLSARIPVSGRNDDIDAVSGQVNAALGRLSSLVEGMKQVSADIAHDLKTPLNRLQIALETISAKVTAGAVIESEVADARAECRNINDTFDALLRIAQIEAGARRARFTDVALENVVADITEAYADVVADAGMVLLCDVKGDRATVSGDRQLLLQLCSNLVENAIRHCPAGTRIVFSMNVTAENVCLTVADNGPGIPADEHTKVLQRLYRLEKSRTTVGSGLGLSLVKAIADLHDAQIQLGDNNPGLLVSIKFPRKPA